MMHPMEPIDRIKVDRSDRIAPRHPYDAIGHYTAICIGSVRPNTMPDGLLEYCASVLIVIEPLLLIIIYYYYLVVRPSIMRD